MSETIQFKKSIIFKTSISKITDINLSHDYKINDDVIEGNFDLTGSYKITEASISNEDFIYNIPFSIALSDRIDKSSINLELDDYNYHINKDVLELEINLKLNYEENKILEDSNDKGNITIDDIELIDNDYELESDIESKPEIKQNKTLNVITNSFSNDEDEVEYKVHIVRENDTIESICEKYKINIEDLKIYNDIGKLNQNDKLIFPIANE